jgi:hypothetical protein
MLKNLKGEFMLKKMIFISLLLVSLVGTTAGVLITPDNSNIQYTGRIDFFDPMAPLFAWPGGHITANFEGTSVAVTMNNLGDGDDNGNVYFAAVIDDGTPAILEFVPGSTTVPIASGLTDSVHKLLLFKRSEYFDGQIQFQGLQLDAGKGLIAPPARPDLKIEFYGDSITVGLGLDWTGSNDNTVNEYTNNYMAYGAQTARNLNAEYHCQAISGIGLVGGWGQMSAYWNLINPTDLTSYWDFNSWVPDVIVQNLGQNDTWQNIPTADEAIQGYVNYVLMYRGAYGPDVHIVLALGSMAASQPGSAWPGYIEAAIDILKNSYGDFRVTSCIFPYDELGKHPDLPAHTAMANQLTTHVQALLDCGNGQCGPGEDACNCPEDCGAPTASETNCSDGKDDDCDGDRDCFDTECIGDAACPGFCGNGLCDPHEDCSSCPGDCPVKTKGPPNSLYCCGDGICEGHETYYPDICPIDCEGTYCGDGNCDTYEDSSNCPQDCGGGGSYCGDGNCDPGEDQCNCSDDCGTPPATETDCTDGINEDCDADTDCDDADCASDPACQSACDNDGICESGEDCNNCPNDCDGVTGGKPSNRYCCGNGIAESPEGDGSICDGNY